MFLIRSSPNDAVPRDQADPVAGVIRMFIYISINGKQIGPFEKEAVLAQLASGNLSPNDMAIRQGDMNWTRLGDMFAGYQPVKPVAAPSPLVQFPPQMNPPQYYNVNQVPNYSGCLQRLVIIIGTRVIVIVVLNLIVFFLVIGALILIWFLQLVGGI